MSKWGGLEDLDPAQQAEHRRNAAIDMAMRGLRGARQRQQLVKMARHERVHGHYPSYWGPTSAHRGVLAALHAKGLVTPVGGEEQQPPRQRRWKLTELGVATADALIEGWGAK